MSEPRIHMRHARALRGRGPTCTRGIRTWCEANGVDLRGFAAEGVAGEEALRIGDAFSLALLELARKEAASNGR